MDKDVLKILNESAKEAIMPEISMAIDKIIEAASKYNPDQCFLDVNDERVTDCSELSELYDIVFEEVNKLLENYSDDGKITVYYDIYSTPYERYNSGYHIDYSFANIELYDKINGNDDVIEITITVPIQESNESKHRRNENDDEYLRWKYDDIVSKNYEYDKVKDGNRAGDTSIHVYRPDTGEEKFFWDSYKDFINAVDLVKELEKDGKDVDINYVIKYYDGPDFVDFEVLDDSLSI